MSMDAKLIEALKTAVAGAGQSEALSRRLVAWLDAVTSGNEDLNDVSTADRHLDLIYSEVSINPSGADESVEDESIDETEDD